MFCFVLVIVRDFPSKKHFSLYLIRLVVSNFSFLKYQPLTPAFIFLPCLQRKTHQVSWVQASGRLLTLPFLALSFLLPWKGSCSPSRNMEVNLYGWYKRFSISSDPNI